MKDYTINKNVQLNKILLISTLCYIFIFIIFVPLKDSSIGDYVRDVDQICLLECSSDKAKKYTKLVRGSQYYITDNDEKKVGDAYSCLFTIWEFSHIFFHFFVGYWADIRYSLAIGIGFEYWEYKTYNCENYTDILWNTIGCAVGSYVRETYKLKK
jgi:hypothetical protein